MNTFLRLKLQLVNSTGGFRLRSWPSIPSFSDGVRHSTLNIIICTVQTLKQGICEVSYQLPVELFRAVRPALWMYSSGESGQSNCTTQSIPGKSIPRAQRSVAISSARSFRQNSSYVAMRWCWPIFECRVIMGNPRFIFIARFISLYNSERNF